MGKQGGGDKSGAVGHVEDIDLSFISVSLCFLCRQYPSGFIFFLCCCIVALCVCDQLFYFSIDFSVFQSILSLGLMYRL